MMTRKYCKWNTSDLDRAIQAMRRGEMGLNAAAKLHGMNEKNIDVNKNKKFHGIVSALGSKLEDELVQHSLVLEERYFGLAMNNLRRLAFELAESNAIPKSFSKENQMAGKKWY